MQIPKPLKKPSDKYKNVDSKKRLYVFFEAQKNGLSDTQKYLIFGLFIKIYCLQALDFNLRSIYTHS